MTEPSEAGVSWETGPHHSTGTRLKVILGGVFRPLTTPRHTDIWKMDVSKPPTHRPPSLDLAGQALPGDFIWESHQP